MAGYPNDYSYQQHSRPLPQQTYQQQGYSPQGGHQGYQQQEYTHQGGRRQQGYSPQGGYKQEYSPHGGRQQGYSPQGQQGYQTEYYNQRNNSPSPGVQNYSLQRQQNWPEHQAVDVEYNNLPTNGNRADKRKSFRHIELTNGNLVLDCDVPKQVLRNVQYTDKDEFTKMRYTAVTCDPDDFIKNKYLLRPHIYGRETELMIVMTMYNEDDKLFIKTMSSAIKNISFLCTRKKSKTWDGRSKINQRVLKVLGAMGVYQDGIMQDSVDGKPVTGHLFEYTSQLMVDKEYSIRGSDKNVQPVQILFCLKEKNAKKLNSHRWFFNAFAAQLKPNVCILLDVGTKPSSTSIYHLWKAFDRDPGVGGACGEIKAELGTGCLNLVNPLVASQNFEYKMSNILDKPLESVFGYISVLPGAFSAYRYRALLDTAPGKGPLASYFKGEAMHGSGAVNAGIFEANMYLAEDRILCFELVTKKNEAWKLKYVKSAKAETDVPDNVPEFISQRRRWLNGSFFAAFYSLANFSRIWSSGQPLYRMILLQIEFMYNAINLLFNWFALGNFYLAFFFLTQSTIATLDTYGREAFNFARSLYIMVIVTIFICSMGNRPQGSKRIYILCIVLFALLMVTMMLCAVYTVYLSFKDTNFKSYKDIKNALKQAAFRDIVISLLSTYGLYFGSSIIHAEPWHMFTCLFQYTLLIPFYVNILMVYAFCNTHDVSWGTKGDNGSTGSLGSAQAVPGKDGKQMMKVEMLHEPEDINRAYENLVKDLRIKVHEEKKHRDAATKKEDYYRMFRTNLVLAWMFSNALLVVFFTSDTWNNFFMSKSTGTVVFNPYLTFIFWSVTGLSAFRAFGCIWYLILRMIFG
ncbi:12896_t:CDS:2 [Dentiscutata heterogama]|uniref:12896_t:CDS:1 n=1 Tax=Dentiscutata heterogama TaxID=1316150 RepID=A0ACA9LA16_9GLOM|nr:12896_t:CDS:2 [Dentiscutata heterogama]